MLALEKAADQSVSVGTAVEELNLPEALEAYAMQNQNDSDDDSEKTGDGEDDTVSENDGDEGDSDTETGERAERKRR